LPKLIIEGAGLKDDVEILVENGAVVIRPARKPREGWAEAIEKFGPPKIVWPDFPNEFDKEWKW